ncbi:MAG TPA: DUF4189 domain-containing protein [Xanthobacteraceae bacterium]|nr:DUF4189 domain-containing protein [Xanthobacteraceae bacterium]
MIIGVLALVAAGAMSPCRAAGALAVGEASDGRVWAIVVNAPTIEQAGQAARARCRSGSSTSERAKALCRIYATFQHQCVAVAAEQDRAGSGFGWALGPNTAAADYSAQEKCWHSTGRPLGQNSCATKNYLCDGSAK